MVQLLAGLEVRKRRVVPLPHLLENLRWFTFSQVVYYCVAPVCEVLAKEFVLLQPLPVLHGDDALL